MGTNLSSHPSKVHNTYSQFTSEERDLVLVPNPIAEIKFRVAHVLLHSQTIHPPKPCSAHLGPHCTPSQNYCLWVDPSDLPGVEPEPSCQLLLGLHFTALKAAPSCIPVACSDSFLSTHLVPHLQKKSGSVEILSVAQVMCVLVGEEADWINQCSPDCK